MKNIFQVTFLAAVMQKTFISFAPSGFPIELINKQQGTDTCMQGFDAQAFHSNTTFNKHQEWTGFENYFEVYQVLQVLTLEIMTLYCSYNNSQQTI